MSETSFTDRRVLITGAGRGIGLATARRFASFGADVLIADVDEDLAAAAAHAVLADGGKAEAFPLDVTSAETMATAGDRVGSLDVVVANAGIQLFGPASQLDTQDWDRVLQVNARGTLLTLQFAARCLADGGAIVTLASIQGFLPNALSAHYAASKAAVASLTKSFAAELAPRGIRVNAVAPGRIATGMSDHADAEIGRLTGQGAESALERRIKDNPLGRLGRPEEVAAAITFLASPDASYITGECLKVCGGDLMT
ncbi:SDR family NAD(P)-dependent oxidoreductase [Amycolatopsis sp. NPDC051903]|uniref:SDR family NAD(P)-dependent oxidoreductase n=1 Tax=Amycolatopsis sp. NPDC051903 TaxID=3363936 RepID=UPI003788F0FF